MLSNSAHLCVTLGPLRFLPARVHCQSRPVNIALGPAGSCCSPESEPLPLKSGLSLAAPHKDYSRAPQEVESSPLMAVPELQCNPDCYSRSSDIFRVASMWYMQGQLQHVGCTSAGSTTDRGYHHHSESISRFNSVALQMEALIY